MYLLNKSVERAMLHEAVPVLSQVTERAVANLFRVADSALYIRRGGPNMSRPSDLFYPLE